MTIKNRLAKLERQPKAAQARKFRPQTPEEKKRVDDMRAGILLKIDQIEAMRAQGTNPYMYMPSGQLIETAQRVATQDTDPETAELRAEILRRLARIAEARQ